MENIKSKVYDLFSSLSISDLENSTKECTFIDINEDEGFYLEYLDGAISGTGFVCCDVYKLIYNTKHFIVLLMSDSMNDLTYIKVEHEEDVFKDLIYFDQVYEYLALKDIMTYI